MRWRWNINESMQRAIHDPTILISHIPCGEPKDETHRKKRRNRRGCTSQDATIPQRILQDSLLDSGKHQPDIRRIRRLRQTTPTTNESVTPDNREQDKTYCG
jgi:hypothetical protein